MQRSLGTLLGIAISAALGTGAQAATISRDAIAPHAALEMTATRALPRLSGMQDLGRISDAQPLRIVVSLPMRNKSLVDTLLRRQMTPGDSLYGHFLSPAETRAMFSPSGAQLNAVASYLVRSGFTNVHATPDNQLVTADATSGVASRAFSTEIHGFTGRYGRMFANVTPAMVPASLHGMVLGVLGLSNFSMHPSIRYSPRRPQMAPLAVAKPVVSSTPEPCNGITLPAGDLCVANEYDPAQFRTAYDTQGLTAKNTAVAIFTEGDMTSILSDLKLYEKAYGLTPITPQIIHAGIPSSDVSGADEFDLDTQSSSGFAHLFSAMYLYNVTSLTDADTTVGFSRFQTDDLAKAGSASFAGCEIFASMDGSLTTDDEIFARAALQGQTVFNSSGDNGSTCPVVASTGVPGTGLPMESYPDVSPYVVSVGGTTLVASSVAGAPPKDMIGWIGSGGGISIEDSSPFWQQGVVNPACNAPAAVPSVTTMKCVPDIAMDADNQLSPAIVYVGGAAEGVGGTSLASPLALGAWAMIETQRSNALGFAAPLLYQMYKNHTTENATTGLYLPPTVVPPNNELIGGLIDITAGANGQYAAIPGYDNVTGLGSLDIARAYYQVPADYPHGP